MDHSSVVKFEYRKSLDNTTAIYSTSEVKLLDEKLVVQLGNIATQCKAIERSEENCCGSSSKCC